eukprot:158006-Chlamydomonas_euryale.AAC.1
MVAGVLLCLGGFMRMPTARSQLSLRAARLARAPHLLNEVCRQSIQLLLRQVVKVRRGDLEAGIQQAVHLRPASVVVSFF